MFRKLILFIGSFFANLFHAEDIADLQDEEAEENEDGNGIDQSTRKFKSDEEQFEFQDLRGAVRGGWIVERDGYYVFERDDGEVIKVKKDDKVDPALEIVSAVDGREIETDDDQAILRLQMVIDDSNNKIRKEAICHKITLRQFRNAAPFGWKGIKNINGSLMRSYVTKNGLHCIIYCDQDGYAKRSSAIQKDPNWAPLKEEEKIDRVDFEVAVQPKTSGSETSVCFLGPIVPEDKPNIAKWYNSIVDPRYKVSNGVITIDSDYIYYTHCDGDVAKFKRDYFENLSGPDGEPTLKLKGLRYYLNWKVCELISGFCSEKRRRAICFSDQKGISIPGEVTEDEFYDKDPEGYHGVKTINGKTYRAYIVDFYVAILRCNKNGEAISPHLNPTYPGAEVFENEGGTIGIIQSNGHTESADDAEPPTVVERIHKAE